LKNPILHINKNFESRIRLGIMSVLLVNEHADFNDLKAYLEVTDGNLASHLRSLEALDYILVKKQFMGRKPRTTYFITPAGREAFTQHISALELLINKAT